MSGVALNNFTFAFSNVLGYALLNSFIQQKYGAVDLTDSGLLVFNGIISLVASTSMLPQN